MFKTLAITVTHNENTMIKKRPSDYRRAILILEAGIDERLEFKSALKRIFGFSLIRFDQLNKLFGLNKIKTWKLYEIPNLSVKQLNLYLPYLNFFGVRLMKMIDVEREKYLELRCYKRNSLF